MPNFTTYHDRKNIYSVDMMIAFLNTHEHPVKLIEVEELVPQLDEVVWDVSPKTVLENMNLKKYSEDAKRIKNADLSYPIIIYKNKIVDGYHRVSRAHLEGKKEIKAHVFDTNIMKKFIVDKDMNFVKVHKDMKIHELLELFIQRFS